MIASHHAQLILLNGRGQSWQAHTGNQPCFYCICLHSCPILHTYCYAGAVPSQAEAGREGVHLNRCARPSFPDGRAGFKYLRTGVGPRQMRTRDADGLEGKTCGKWMQRTTNEVTPESQTHKLTSELGFGRGEVVGTW